MCQRSVFSGLIISGIFYYLSSSAVVESIPKLPFLDVEFSSIESLRFFLLILYVGTGVIAWYFSHRAVKILSSIEDNRVEMAVSKYPCIIVSNFGVRLCLAAALVGMGIVILFQIFNDNYFYIIFLTLIVYPPFYMTLENGKEIYDWGNSELERKDS